MSLILVAIKAIAVIAIIVFYFPRITFKFLYFPFFHPDASQDMIKDRLNFSLMISIIQYTVYNYYALLIDADHCNDASVAKICIEKL